MLSMILRTFDMTVLCCQLSTKYRELGHKLHVFTLLLQMLVSDFLAKFHSCP